jgi:hypothetical protein
MVLAPGSDAAFVSRRVATAFTERFGADVRADVVVTDAIDRTASGKVRPVISQRGLVALRDLTSGASRV